MWSTSRRTLFAALLLIAVAASGTAAAQPGNRPFDMKAQVLDALFPRDVDANSYFIKLGMRFGDSCTQVTVVVYPLRKAEMARTRLAGVACDDLAQFIEKEVANNPAVRAQELASRLKVDVTRTPVDYDTTLAPGLNQLKAIRISPVLASRISVDDYSEYEFWYDAWQESVHYTLVTPFENEPQDELGRWMMRFRTQAETLF